MSDADTHPVIVQSDRSVLLETDGDAFEDARDAIAAFAELVKSPEHIHTYRLTPLSLWNAAAAGMTAKNIIDGLTRFSRYEIPQNIIVDIEDNVSRYGRLKLYKT
jgi:DNA excision repair protein ERCC-3